MGAGPPSPLRGSVTHVVGRVGGRTSDLLTSTPWARGLTPPHDEQHQLRALPRRLDRASDQEYVEVSPIETPGQRPFVSTTLS